VPAAYRGRARAYLDEVAWPATQAAHAAGLAQFVDAFVEEGAFAAEEIEPYLRRARDLGLGIRIHADQLSRSGAASLAARLAPRPPSIWSAPRPRTRRRWPRRARWRWLLPGAALTVDGRGGARPPTAACGRPACPSPWRRLQPGHLHGAVGDALPRLACRLFGLSPRRRGPGSPPTPPRAWARPQPRARAPGYQADLCVWDVPRAADIAYVLDAHRPRAVIVRGRVVEAGR